MFNKKKFKDLFVKRHEVNPNDGFAIGRIWQQWVDIIFASEESFNEFLDYMITEMPPEEFEIIYELYDDIMNHSESEIFIDNLEVLVNRYPEEAEDNGFSDIISFYRE